MRTTKYWVFICALLVASCATSQAQTQESLVTGTPILPTSIPPSPTPDYIIVMRVVTPTSIPALAQDCFDTALKQREIDDCAILERELAKAELEKIISKIKFTAEEKQEFDELQLEWDTLIQKDCEFLYGQIVTDENGNLFYKRGSMAPMLWALCVAEQYKRRIEDLKYAYLNH